MAGLLSGCFDWEKKGKEFVLLAYCNWSFDFCFSSQQSQEMEEIFQRVKQYTGGTSKHYCNLKWTGELFEQFSVENLLCK